jgi:hypothetical protein
MSTLLSELKASIRNSKKAWRQQRDLYKEYEPDIAVLVGEMDLSGASSARMECDTEDVNLYVSGGADVLKEIFHAFRKLGYEPSSRPEAKPQSNFSCYFRQDGKPTFYLSFSSTLCRRVKVGTKMQEIDVYETVCE